MYKRTPAESALLRVATVAITLLFGMSAGSVSAAPVFSAAGPGTVIVTDADLGDDLQAQFTYNMRPAGFSTRTWTFLATATTTGPITINYQWRGFHAFFAVTTLLETIDSAGTTGIISDGPVNCCTSPSAGFNYVGQVTLNTVAGQQYGFRLGGSNFDSNNVLRGTLTISRPDDDGDNVANEDDYCPDTVIPEGVPTNGLGTNRWALVDSDFNFDTTAPSGNGPGRSYSTSDTAGCSCEQIIEALSLGAGHTKFGCSISAMDDWVELVTP